MKEHIRNIKDYPKKGIVFRDITTLLQNAQAFRNAVKQMIEMVKNKKIDYVVSAESRGFIFGSILAYELGVGFIPVRKKGKLPWSTNSVNYELEYGIDSLEIHKDAFRRGDKILLIDDLLATGGTTQAMIKLIEIMGGDITGIAFLIELEFLKGREKLKPYQVVSLIKYETE